MDEKLSKLADEAVKDPEYKELFPETPVKQAKKDKEKVKEALFQVHHMVYNRDIHEIVKNKDEDYYIRASKLRDICDGDKEFERVQKLLKGATLSEDNEGNTLVPKTDLKNMLKPRSQPWD